MLQNYTQEPGEVLEFQLYKGVCWRDHLSPLSLSPRPDIITVDKVGHLSFSVPLPPNFSPSSTPLWIFPFAEFTFSYRHMYDLSCIFFINSHSRENIVLTTWKHTFHKVGKRKIVSFWLGRWVKPSCGRQQILEGTVGLK